MGGSGSDMIGSPQAVFTSFKLPKPGNMDLNLPTSPFGRFPPMPFQTTTTTPSGSAPRVLSAPLGGLPAVDSQVAARQQQQHQQQHHHYQQPQRRLSTPDRDSDDDDDQDADVDVSPAKISRISETESRHDRGGSSDESPPKAQGLIKDKGTYYPLTAFPTTMPQGPVMHRDGSPPRSEVQPSTFICCISTL